MNFATAIGDYTKEQLVQLLIHQQTMNAKLTHELAILKRQKFAATSEAYAGEQQRELFETLDIDLAAVTAEMEQLALTHPIPAEPNRQQPKRMRLPAELPRTEIHHEPDSTLCRCGCQMRRIGEDVSEKLDYQPGVFTVERHVRGKWVCNQCETLVQAPVPAQIIDKGIPTSGLLAQVLVAKYADHLPLYRQSGIFERAGLPFPIPRWPNGWAAAGWRCSRWWMH
jgi:transposase